MSELLAEGVLAFQSAQSALPINGPLLAGGAAFMAVQTAVAAAATTIDGNASTADANMAAIVAAIPPGAVISAPDALSAVTVLTNAVDAANDMAGLRAMSGFVNRMAANLTHASN